MKKSYVLVQLWLLCMVAVVQAQVTRPDSVVVELTGPATSVFVLPAKMVVKNFAPATTTFTGSNNKPEKGYTDAGYYSQEVEQGATFFPINGMINGFPPRTSTSVPSPNRTGGSSFLAIKTDAEGNRKYWMNLSVGGYRNSGTQIMEWEYQFRYFYDTKTGVETGTIGSVPASDEYVPTQVDFLVSLGNQKCKDFTGVVKNSVANIIAARITNDPLADATVMLKDGGKTIHSVKTDANGSFKFLADTLSKEKLYSITVSYNADTLPLTYTVNDIKICNAAPEFYIPNKLYRQVLTEASTLKDLKIDADVFGGTVAEAIPIKDYDFTAINQEVAKWRNIDDKHKEILEIMNRTYLSMYLFNQYYSKSNEVSGKLLKLTYDVAEGIFKMFTATKNINGLIAEESGKIDRKLLEGVSGVELLQLKKDLILLNTLKGIVTKIEKALLDGFKEKIVKAALAKFGNGPYDKLAKTSILTLSKALEAHMFGGNLGEDILKTIAFNLGTKILVDQYYIGTTQTYIDKISPKITGLSYEGTFAGVAPLVNARVAETTKKNDEAILAGEAFESASGQFGTVSEYTESIAKVAAMTVFGAPLAPPLLTISKFVKGFSLVSNSAALYEYSSRYFYITDELQQGLAKSFSPSGNMLRVGQEEVQARLEANPLTEMEVYKDSLVSYRSKTGSYNMLKEAELIGKIDSIEEVVNNRVAEKVNMFYAAISGNTTNVGLMKVYNEVVKNNGDFTTRQTALDIALLTHLIDTANAGYQENVRFEIDTLLIFTEKLQQSLAKIDSALPTVTTPYQLVRVSGVTLPDSIVHDSQFEITVKYKNYGNTETSAFDVLAEPSEDLKFIVDSVRVPALAAQQEASVKFLVTASDITSNPYVYVSFGEVNSLSETILLQLFTKVKTRGQVTGGIDKQATATAVSIYPNPASSVIFIRSNRVLDAAKVTVFDAQGTLHISQQLSKTGAVEEMSISTQDLKPGIYILNLEDAKGYVVKRERIVISDTK